MEFPDRAHLESVVDDHELPGFARVAYEPETETLENLRERVREAVVELSLSELERGSTVAVGVGSRGIHGLADYVREVIDALADRGLEPVIVPAMGSHGGATPEGQREVLESLGVTEAAMGAPIDARMAVEEVGAVTVGDTPTPVYVSRAALEADALLVVNRVKPHTNFTGRLESGLCKMTVVGLGKREGANAFHSTAIAEGYVPTLEALLSVVRDALPLRGGVAIVENADEETAQIEGVRADGFESREPELLEAARREMATLPFDDLDLLVVDEIGKEISGAGMDTNVIGRYRVLNAPDPENPDVDLIYVRGLTDETHGNGNGIGLADLTRQSAIDQLDLEQTYTNAVTSGSLAKATLPVVAPDDELAVHIALGALGGYDPERARIVRIRNTTDLSELHVSEALLEDADTSADLEVLEREQLVFEDGTMRFVPR
ncbi:DUF362 domain-containing protein [Natrarchaeobaculum aegyptiacum]|uniref:DUF362 domain-containing protein n=1 Tax=Natrarchaeobaculum aegyptiacum TaxID=745377 RepID=A0A2Z2HZD5_9EURY|nr:DUF362 domain-containing protein [Natrarchaeobaculum aegyptiacum]ARS91865.1 DUF362 domain-containing protein [Natrarchaeobaculum aegyptiacum]